ncbi:MAG TPA: trypsin-like serine protease, partial [Polyangiaceae bacterium]|nr:trypsin-like serine protease [Polyangiaceae bacterium]
MPGFNALTRKHRVVWGSALLSIAGIGLDAGDARAISGGTDATDAAYAFVVKLDIGAGTRSCSGALVQPLWVVTAASCFKVGDQAVPRGAPSQPTTATVGRPDLTATSGYIVSVVQVIPAPDRNLVLVKLAKRIEGVTPIRIAGTPAASGERLRIAGYGRTGSEWVPQRLQVASFSVQSVAATTLSVAGAEAPSANTCKGDSGGPTWRDQNGTLELVGITNTSWQSGCLAETETRAGATQARVDDLGAWITQQTTRRHQYGSVAATSAVSCNCLDFDCWGRFCATPDCQVCQYPTTTYDVKTGDYDADGKTDILTLSPNATGGWPSVGIVELSRSGRFDSQTWQMGTPAHMRNGGANRYYRTLQGDFDGNGTSDLATLSFDGGGGWANWLALELAKSGRFESQVWSAKTPGYMRASTSSAFVTIGGDFNGDGKTDLATLSPEGNNSLSQRIAVELAKDGGGFDSQLWAASTPVHTRNGGAPRAYFTLAGDYNGDGLTDLATISPNGGGGWAEWIAVELARSGGGFDSHAWPASTPIRMRNGGSGARYHVLAADFTGDGRTDLATVSENAGGGWSRWIALEVAKAGGGFESPVWNAGTPVHMRNGGANADYRVLASDVNGDGKA